MPKLKLGTGNKRAVLQRPNTSYTSPRAIKQRQRQAQALDCRLQGHAYHRIAQELHCHPSTAHDLVVKALRDIVPQEKAEAVLQLELRRFDALLEKYYPLALKGDQSAAELCLKISHQRSRLCGLYDQPPLLELKAERPNIALNFVKGVWVERPDGTAVWDDGESPDRPKTIDHWPAPTINGPDTKQ